MGRKRVKESPVYEFVVVSYYDDVRRLHQIPEATSYRAAKREAAKELRGTLGLWDVNLAEITNHSMMVARKVPKGVL